MKNEIFVGAKVIHGNRLCRVLDLPMFCETGWYVSLDDGYSVSLCEIIMPEGLNDLNLCECPDSGDSLDIEIIIRKYSDPQLRNGRREKEQIQIALWLKELQRRRKEQIKENR